MHGRVRLTVDLKTWAQPLDCVWHLQAFFRFTPVALRTRPYRMDNYRNLQVWRDAGELIDLVYGLTRALPLEEHFVASTQLRRAVWSVQNNIAEGNARYGRREMRQFLRISVGSLAEVDSMVAKLSELYELEADVVLGISVCRRRINAGLSKMMTVYGR